MREEVKEVPKVLRKSKFAAFIGRTPQYVTKLLGEGRLVMTSDGKRVMVVESLELIAQTRGFRDDMSAHWAARAGSLVPDPQGVGDARIRAAKEARQLLDRKMEEEKKRRAEMQLAQRESSVERERASKHRWYVANREKYCQLYAVNKREKFAALSPEQKAGIKERLRAKRHSLPDWYVRRLFKLRDVPKSLLELKRVHIQINRLIGEINGIDGKASRATPEPLYGTERGEGGG